MQRFQGGAISTIRRSAHPSGCVGRVPRAHEATGAYEGSLRTEGVSGRGSSLFSRRVSRKRSRRRSVVEAPQPESWVAKRRAREGALPSARRPVRQRRQRYDRVVAVGAQRPRRQGRFPAGLRSDIDPPKRSWWREPPFPPEQARGAPRLDREAAGEPAPRGA